MKTVCTCNSKPNIRLTDFTIPYVYGSIKYKNIYKLNTTAYVFSCNNCSAIWNNKETLTYQLNECLEWVDRMLPILMNEVSLKVAVLRGKDYLANGYYRCGYKVIPPKLDELLFSEISQLIETVVADIYWGSARKTNVYYTVSP